ncbi:MAG: response regulator [Tenericutes bacterium]|nr:response regulator [Mycoplasmatota bacterium]
MTSLYFPICAAAIASLLTISFFSKKRVDNTETKLYSYLLIINLIETIENCITIYLVKTYGMGHSLNFLFRLDYLLIFGWVWILFLYVYHISFNKKDFKKDKLVLISIVLTVIVFIGLLFADFNVINHDNIIDTTGTAANIVFVGSAIYVLLIISFITKSIISNINNLKNKKYIPLYSLAVLAIMTLVLRQINPTLTLEALVMAYINLIMYFTIENPDLKLLEVVKESKEEIDKINIDKSNFLFNITKDMKNNLKNINKYIEEILTKKDDKVTQENLYEIQLIISNCERTINSSLDISEEDALKIRSLNNKYNIKSIIKVIVLQTKSKISKNINFITEIENDLPEYLYGDSVKLKQILVTLLDKAIENTKEGFIELKINSIKKKDLCRLIITVEDSGIGIDSKTVDKIFIASDEKHDFMTNNLTLKSISKIVHLIGGTFNISSQINYGTKVTVTLDQKIDKESNDNLSNYIKDLDFANILIISEDLRSCNKIKELFKKERINTNIINSGEQGLKKIRNNEKYNLIIIDYNLSKLNGLEIYSKLKNINKFESLIVMLMGEKDKDLELEAQDKKIGICKIIKKPIKAVDVKEIANLIKKEN